MQETYIYEEQARYFRNIPLLDPSIKACIHIEDKEDRDFWDYHLQRVSPANYKYISHSKSVKGLEATGCEQCLRYHNYLSEKFFICIDSDLRLLRGETNIDAEHYIAQTYTYSWENHCCEAEHLQSRLRSRIPDIDELFDFRIFFRNLSFIMYEPLMLLLHYERTNPSKWNLRMFNACIPLQPKREELTDNGAPLLQKMKNSFSEATNGLTLPENYHLDIPTESIYLHIRGHQLFPLTMHIGTMLCKGRNIAFLSEILKMDYPTDGYPEITCLYSDLMKITKTN